MCLEDPPELQLNSIKNMQLIRMQSLWQILVRYGSSMEDLAIKEILKKYKPDDDDVIFIVVCSKDTYSFMSAEHDEWQPGASL